jgi:hypothetical protein
MLNRVLSTQRKGALVLNAVDTEESKTKPKMERLAKLGMYRHHIHMKKVAIRHQDMGKSQTTAEIQALLIVIQSGVSLLIQTQDGNTVNQLEVLAVLAILAVLAALAVLAVLAILAVLAVLAVLVILAVLAVLAVLAQTMPIKNQSGTQLMINKRIIIISAIMYQMLTMYLQKVLIHLAMTLSSALRCSTVMDLTTRLNARSA